MLSDNDFHVPSDPAVLRMENELLKLENSLLRGGGTASSAQVSTAIERAVRDEREKGREAVHRVRAKYEADKAERRARFASVPHEKLARLQKAESDIRWLVGRLDGTPLGLVLRRWEGWRTLLSRYGA